MPATRPISTTSIKKFCSICGGASAGSKDAAGRHRGYIASACISCYRRERRHRGTLPLEYGIGLPAEEGDRTEHLKELYALIDRLDPIEKALILLWLDEVPYDEIAAITGLGRNTVASKLRRIRLKLREQAENQ